MLEQYSSEIAKQMGVKLSKVVVVDGESVGCLGACLLKLISETYQTEVLVYPAELSNLENNLACDRLNMKITAAVSSLKKSLGVNDVAAGQVADSIAK